MSQSTERREFFRTRADVEVQYRFLADYLQDPDLGKMFRGTTNNLSGGGLLLHGILPKLEWVPDLLMQKMAVGVSLQLPTENAPVLGLARVAWIETIDDRTRHCRLGLRYREITTADRDRLFQFVIHQQVP